MNIGFDAKRALRNFTGLGNYSRFVINNLARFYPDNSYLLFTSKYAEGCDNIIRNDSVEIVTPAQGKMLWRTFGIPREKSFQTLDLYHGLSAELPVGFANRGVKTVVTIHDLIFLRYPHLYKPFDRAIYNAKARYACSMADRIIAISECTKRDIVRFYGTDPGKIDVVYQGCFPEFRQKVTEAQRTEVVAKYKLPDKFVLSVGSIEERKNIMLVVKALKQLKDVEFVAVGRETSYAEVVRSYAAANGLSERVHFRSGIPFCDLPALIQACAVFVYPSRFEGFGIPVIEALNSAVPVIAATGSCLEEAGGPSTLYVDPDNVSQMAATLQEVLCNASLRQKMVREGLTYVEKFSDRNCTDALIQLYNSVL